MVVDEAVGGTAGVRGRAISTTADIGATAAAAGGRRGIGAIGKREGGNEREGGDLALCRWGKDTNSKERKKKEGNERGFPSS
jgi:hypothetical protein